MQTLGPISSKIRQWVWVNPENLHVEQAPQVIVIQFRATPAERGDGDGWGGGISPGTFQIQENQLDWVRWFP